MLSPSKPYSFACSIAISNLFTAMGYSALIYTKPSEAPIAYAAIAIASITA